MKAQQITNVGLFIALLAIGSQIVIPFGVIPFTLQTLIVYLIGFLLKPREAALTTFLYTGLGLMGFPVFAGWNGGPHAIVTPSFGFILGFILATIAMSSLIHAQTTRSLFKYLGVGMVGSMIITLIGLAYMYGYFNLYLKTNESFQQVVLWGFIPFIFGDLIKVVLAAFVAQKFDKFIN